MALEQEPVFIAATVAEAEFVEELLDREGIEFELTPEPYLRGGMFSVMCLQGLLFIVLRGQAAYCRALLTDAGLERGVVNARDYN
ncbi:MAG TPA: hypothetical protein VF911_13090 [Thermoanaerobaculia bacterium]|jgi:hypothetical protein